MNETAQRILTQLGVRKALLLSLAPSGMFVGSDPDTGLFHGRVDGVFALVPIEHAEFIPQSKLGLMRARGLDPYIKGCHIVPAAEAVAGALLDLDAEAAWVRECGGGPVYPRDAIDAG